MSADPVTVPPPKGFIDPIAYLTGGNPPPGGPGDYYFLRVCGDSIAETAGIYDGDMVLVKRSAEPQPGDMAITLVGDDATIRRYGSREWALEVEARALQLGVEVVVQGVVCGIVRRF